MDKLISVVIPCRKGENADITLRTLRDQTFTRFTTILVIDAYSRGASWARNRGFLEVRTPFVLFSDNDLLWYPTALDRLHYFLNEAASASYSYGWYELGNGVALGRDRKFSPRDLVKGNFISTMSLIRTDDFPGFDENLRRLQDWDLWLTMLRQKKVGVYANTKLFRTEGSNSGITATEDLSVATNYIVCKHDIIR